LKYGTGPVVDFSGGIPVSGNSGSFQASQMYQAGNSGHAAANLQPNDDDNPQGDVVSGTYTASSGATNTSYKVQLRRSNDTPISGELSTGPPLPYLFGRGTLLGANLKARGITVRAKSVAAGQPAMSAGKPDVDSSLAKPLPGVTPFVLDKSAWDQLTTDTIAPNGTDPRVMDLSKFPSAGYAFDPAALSLGQTATVAANANSFNTYLPINITLGYVPVVDRTLAVPLQNSVIGFGYVTISTTGTTTTITRQTGKVAPENASPILTQSSGLSAADFATIYSSFQTFSAPSTSSGPSPALLAPALVRPQ
jgi:hypothetical protein